jgi:hypothetical protein
MPRQADPAAGKGFALILVLLLVAVVGLLGVGSLQEALFGEALASTRLLNQRASLVAEAGLRDAIRSLAAGPAVADYTRELRPSSAGAESAVVSLRHVGRSNLAAGYSIGRFETHYYVIQSTGRGPRGTSTTQVQGVSRVLPSVVVEAAP